MGIELIYTTNMCVCEVGLRYMIYEKDPRNGRRRLLLRKNAAEIDSCLCSHKRSQTGDDMYVDRNEHTAVSIPDPIRDFNMLIDINVNL